MIAMKSFANMNQTFNFDDPATMMKLLNTLSLISFLSHVIPAIIGDLIY